MSKDLLKKQMMQEASEVIDSILELVEVEGEDVIWNEDYDLYQVMNDSCGELSGYWQDIIGLFVDNNIV